MNKVAYQDFDEIFREYDSVITYKTIKKIGKVTPDWEDVRSEIYLSLIKALNGSSFRGDCNIGTLIYVITNRRAIDFIRLKYAIAKTIENLMLYYQEETPPDPKDAFIEKESGEILHSLIQELQGWRQRQVTRRYLLGVSASEMSRQLGLSPSSVSGCLDTSKRNLKNLYKKEA